MYHDHAIDPLATLITPTGHGTVELDLVGVGGEVDRFEIPYEAALRMAQRLTDAVAADRNMLDRNWQRRRQQPGTEVPA
jgi:hypothetical protein